MKKFFVIIGVALIAFSCTNGGFKINGNIEDATDQMVYLKTLEGNDLVTVDSSMMKSGKFTFKGNLEVPNLYALDLGMQGERIVFFLENSNVKVEGKAGELMLSEVIGSKEQDLLMSFNDFQEELAQPLMAIQMEFQMALQEGVMTPELEEELRSRFMEESEKLNAASVEFVKEHPGSVVSAYITLTQLAQQLSFEELEELVEGFTGIDKSPFVISLKEKLELERKTAIGQMYMDFSHPDKDGNMIDFSSVIGENYVLLDFWAGWCAPCRHENPNLVNLYKTYGKKGFDIFGVSLDRSREEWLGAIEQDGITWTQVSDIKGWENSIARQYGVQSIPTSLLISPEGVIIAKNLRGDALKEKLAELLD